MGWNSISGLPETLPGQESAPLPPTKHRSRRTSTPLHSVPPPGSKSWSVFDRQRLQYASEMLRGYCTPWVPAQSGMLCRTYYEFEYFFNHEATGGVVINLLKQNRVKLQGESVLTSSVCSLRLVWSKSNKRITVIWK